MTRAIDLAVALTAQDSELQLRDVKNLAATGCDFGYNESWTNELGLLNLSEECKP